MSSTPPSGFGYFAITHTVTGALRTPVVTCGFSNAGALNAAAINVLLRAAMQAGANAIWDTNIMSADYSVASTYVLINSSGILTTNTDTTPITGANSIQVPPMNTAIIAKKTSAQAGKQFRGRMFLPPMGTLETFVSNIGIISPAHVTTLNTQLSQFYNALVSSSIPPYLLHNPPLVGSTPAPTPITSFTINPLIGTVKRRIRV